MSGMDPWQHKLLRNTLSEKKKRHLFPFSSHWCNSLLPKQVEGDQHTSVYLYSYKNEDFLFFKEGIATTIGLYFLSVCFKDGSKLLHGDSLLLAASRA